MITTRNLNKNVRDNQPISVTSTEPIDTKDLILSGSEHNEGLRKPRRRLTKSLHSDREQWWVTKAKETENLRLQVASDNYSVIEETGIKNLAISETTSGKDRNITHSQSMGLDQCGEHLRGQFN